MTKGIPTRLLAAAMVLAAAGVSGCQRPESSSVDLATLPLEGRVVSVDLEARTITIDHEPIPDYMAAMTMPFAVKDPALLEQVAAGDLIEATLAISRAESWLEEIHVTGSGPAPATLTAEEVQDRHLLHRDEPLPDVVFTNHDGRELRIADLAGRVVALTFVYTRCPLPDFCIRMSSYFAAVQAALKLEPELAGKWHLLTISFDPDHDQPAILKAYGESYGADFSSWDFVTASPESIRALADGLDLLLQADEGELIAHNLRTVLLQPDGGLHRVIAGNSWTPAELVDEIRDLIVAGAGE